MRKSVENFAKAMEGKLQKHDFDYGKWGWMDTNSCDDEFLLERLKEELKEFETSQNPDEMVDVANFAMMIWERLKS